MDIKKLYTKVSEKINNINFESLWNGFHRFSFALYDKTTVYLEDDEIPVDNRFLGNTNINYEGEQIAIWKVDNEEEVKDLDLFTANIVHEMFHCYQYDYNDKRYPNDLVLLDYPDDVENFSLKYQENIYLVQGLDSIEAFKNFVGKRRRRRELIGDIIEQELRIETMEGLAEYVGLMALKQLSVDKYNERIAKYANIITTLSDLQFNIRRISYFTGALFYIALFNNSYTLNNNLTSEETFFNQLINSYTFGTYNKKISANKELENKFNNYLSNKESKINDFIDTHDNEIKFKSVICGYDPMNMIKMNGMILCTHFIFLKQIDGEENKFIKQPVLLRMQEESEKIVESYII